MKHIRQRTPLILLFAALLAACAAGGNEPAAAPEDEQPATVEATPATTPAGEEVTHGGPIEDYVSAVDALRFTGATVQPAGTLSQPFFEPQAQVVELNGERVQIFVFPDEEAAVQAAGTVSPDGSSVGATMLTWQDTPHFYRANRVIFLYVGSDQSILDVLQEAIGQPFAAG